MARRSIVCLRSSLVALLLAMSAPGPLLSAAGTEPDTLEYAVKAAYLYKFGEFVEWPGATFESSSSAINLCVVGGGALSDVLEKAAQGRLIGERPIVTRRLNSVERNSGCQILFAGDPDARRVGQALDTVRGTGVLTITDVSGPASGGIIHFVVQDNHLRFEIDERAAAANGLTISSKLFRLAASVKNRT